MKAKDITIGMEVICRESARTNPYTRMTIGKKMTVLAVVGNMAYCHAEPLSFYDDGNWWVPCESLESYQ